jgi:hypothetical protein
MKHCSDKLDATRERNVLPRRRHARCAATRPVRQRVDADGGATRRARESGNGGKRPIGGTPQKGGAGGRSPLAFETTQTASRATCRDDAMATSSTAAGRRRIESPAESRQRGARGFSGVAVTWQSREEMADSKTSTMTLTVSVLRRSRLGDTTLARRVVGAVDRRRERVSRCTDTAAGCRGAAPCRGAAEGRSPLAFNSLSIDNDATIDADNLQVAARRREREREMSTRQRSGDGDDTCACPCERAWRLICVSPNAG